MLCRTNARLADFEEVLHGAGIPFQGSSLLEREAARRLLRLLAREQSTAVSSRVRSLAEEAGLLTSLPAKLGERELVRQADLARLVRLAEELDDGELTCAGFAAELRSRFDPGGGGARGVHLSTYHRAKGLEFEAVFLPRIEDKELPSRLSRTDADVDEERRLLYVGITRAKRTLALTWSGRPSPFLRELGIEPARGRSASARRSGRAASTRPVARRGGSATVAPGAGPRRRRCRRTSSSPIARSTRSSNGVRRASPSSRASTASALRDSDASAGSSQPRSRRHCDWTRRRRTRSHDGSGEAAGDGALYGALAAWRRDRSRSEAVPPFHVFGNRVLAAIADARPRSRDELAEIAGVGPRKLERYADEVLEVVASTA